MLYHLPRKFANTPARQRRRFLNLTYNIFSHDLLHRENLNFSARQITAYRGEKIRSRY